MANVEELQRENEALRDRLSRLSEASLRINESLDLTTVLQGVLDSACSLTGARYGVIILLNEAGRIGHFLYSGLTPEESRRFAELPDGMLFFEYLGSISEPLRLRDFHSHTRALGLPEFRPPMAVSSPLPFLVAPLRHRGEGVGGIYVGETEGSLEFAQEDEATLAMFASQAALVIANARRHREEQRARTDLETLVNTTPVGVLVFDARTGNPVSVNREARRVVSELCKPGETVEHLLEVLRIRRADGREVSLGEFPLVKALTTGETVRAEEIVLQAPHGKRVTTLINSTPIRSEEGEIESVVVTMQDMTPLEELERLRAEFLAMVSHELRTPLASIRGSATTLLNDEPDLDPAEMRQFHRIIEQEASRMRGLIGDLLDVARIETGTLPMAPAPVEVVDLVDEARSGFLSGGGGNPLHIDIPPDLPWVAADRRRIVQVLSNLLSNAARHSPELAAIRVAAAREGVYVAFSVADDGAGIPAEGLPRLFRKFSRLDGEDRGRGFGGTGLGLAICKGIVEAHGGRIRAESEGPELGSRFTFTLPVAQEEGVGRATGPARRHAGLQPLATERTRVLAVDDDPQTLRYVRDALSKAGYALVVTGDPDEALGLMKKERPSLVLLDLMLPGTNGIDLMQGILEIADVPVIFLSAYGQDDVVVRAFDMGADDYVVKPFAPTELAARIRAALRRREAKDRTERSEPYVLGDLAIDYPERGVTLAGRPVDLTATEYDVLFELSVNSGRVLDHAHLLQKVWGPGNSGDARLVRTIVRRLRRKLGDDADNPTYIFTVPRVGYRVAKGETAGPKRD